MHGGARLRGYESLTARLTAPPDIDIDIPWPRVGNKLLDVTVPAFALSDESITVSAPDLGSVGAHFQLRLVMVDGRLAIRLVSGNQQQDTFLDGQ